MPSRRGQPPQRRSASSLQRFIRTAIVDVTDGDRSPRYRLRHAVAEMQGRAAPERCVDRIAIAIAYLSRRLMAGICHPRRRDDLAVAFEGKADRVLHTVTR